MKFLKDKQTRHDFVTYAMCLVAFAIVFFMQSNHMIPRMIAGQLVPITAYIVMAISLNLVVGIAGDLSLGHAGFMSVGAYTGIVTAVALESAVPSDPVRLIISIVVGAIAAAILGFLIGIPVLRLSGDYLAIVTLAFGEIIKEIVTCLIVGVDSRGLHVIFNITGNSTIDDLHLLEDGTAIIKGAQGASGVSTYSTFLAGAILVMVAQPGSQPYRPCHYGRARQQDRCRVCGHLRHRVPHDRLRGFRCPRRCCRSSLRR